MNIKRHCEPLVLAGSAALPPLHAVFAQRILRYPLLYGLVEPSHFVEVAVGVVIRRLHQYVLDVVRRDILRLEEPEGLFNVRNVIYHIAHNFIFKFF